MLFLDRCLEGTHRLWLWVATLARFGIVALLRTCSARGSVGGALGSSRLPIGGGVGKSCAVSTYG